jgi:hypothetical protein
MKLKSVGVLSVAVVFGILYTAIGLIVGAIFSLIIMVAGAAALAPQQGNSLGGLLFGGGAIVLFPILYGAIGFIGGALTAALYNLVAKFTGGIVMNLEPPTA